MRHFPPPDRPAPDICRLAVEITGAVQGVGFRPFVYRLAVEEGLSGWVRNTTGGVSLEIEGEENAAARFVARIKAQARPPMAIETAVTTPRQPLGETEFRCETSALGGGLPGRVLPDLVLCDACRSEITDPSDRRFGYPFTSCMQCGPRYSIIETLPYDRERTVMRGFPMCHACEGEYRDPASRRFHAETNACPDCGPQLALIGKRRAVVARAAEALALTAGAIRRGRIVAVKGLGGFQLLADARDNAAVEILRERKHRPARPFAVMVRDMAQARAIARITPDEEALLCCSAGPIVLLAARSGPAIGLAPAIAPDSPLVGVMLPTTPLHHIMLTALGFPVVATSGNRSGEPIAASDDEAAEGLADIADLILTHDRPILRRVDDSVVRVIDGEGAVLRCARGYAPMVLQDDRQNTPLVALGGHMKSSVAAAGSGRIVLGPHIGDLDSPRTRTVFEQSADQLARLHAVEPSLLVTDLHAGYFPAAYAEEIALPVERVQHHVAHTLSAMTEHRLAGPVLGIAWDGSGDGGDGTVWGGEFLIVGEAHWHRFAHFRSFPLTGGERCVREPRRSAIGALAECYGEALWTSEDTAPLAAFSHPERRLLRAAMTQRINTPLTSSVGRLFDAAASILDLRQIATFEGEAAMAVEFAAMRSDSPALLPEPAFAEGIAGRQIDWRAMLAALCEGMQAGASRDDLAAGFHHWLAEAACHAAQFANIGQVVLTGGCFQNALLAERVAARLRRAGFRTYLHRKVPCNDGGLAVGQAACAARGLSQEER